MLTPISINIGIHLFNLIIVGFWLRQLGLGKWYVLGVLGLMTAHPMQIEMYLTPAYQSSMLVVGLMFLMIIMLERYGLANIFIWLAWTISLFISPFMILVVPILLIVEGLFFKIATRRFKVGMIAVLTIIWVAIFFKYPGGPIRALTDGLLMAGYNIVHFLKNFILFFDVIPISVWPMPISSHQHPYIFSLLVAGLIILVVSMLIRHSKEMEKLWCLTLVSLWPILGQWQVWDVSGRGISMRYMAIIGLSVMVMMMLKRWMVIIKRIEPLMLWLMRLGLGCVGVSLIIFSYMQIKIWQDPQAFWRIQIQRQPIVENYILLASNWHVGQDYQRDQEYLALLTQGFKQFPQEDRLAVFLGVYYAHQRDWQKAETFLNQAVSLNKQSIEAYLWLAKIYEAQEQWPKALEIYGNLSNAHAHDEKVLVSLVKAYSNPLVSAAFASLYLEKKEGLLEDLEILTQQKNYRAVDFYHLGVLYQTSGIMDHAKRYFKRSLEIDPHYYLSLLALGQMARFDADYKLALTYFQEASRYAKKDSEIYVLMGEMYQQLSDMTRAKQMYQLGIDMNTNNAKAYYYLGYAYELEGNLTKAMDLYNQSVEIDHNNPDTFYNLGNVAAKRELYGEAIAAYLKAVDLRRNHVDTWINLSIVSYKAGDAKGALSYLEKAKALGYNPPEDFINALKASQ